MTVHVYKHSVVIPHLVFLYLSQVYSHANTHTVRTLVHTVQKFSQGLFAFKAAEDELWAAARKER